MKYRHEVQSYERIVLGMGSKVITVLARYLELVTLPILSRYGQFLRGHPDLPKGSSMEAKFSKLCHVLS